MGGDDSGTIARGNIQQISCVCQTEQHSHFGLMVFHLGNVTMYVCTYICMYTYVHTYIHTYVHTCIHTYIHTYVHTYYVHTYIHTCIHTYIVRTYIHTYVCTCIHTYIVRTYIHTYVHAYIHTYMHTKCKIQLSYRNSGMSAGVNTMHLHCVKHATFLASNLVPLYHSSPSHSHWGHC